MGAPSIQTASLTLATLNLYHWAEPGIGWYEPGGGHSSESWSAKRAWLVATLREMQADIVGFQEVVTLSALQEDCAAAGLGYFAAVAEPVIEQNEGRRYYTRPVQAVASRWPIKAEAAACDREVSLALGLAADRGFRRPAMRVELSPEGSGPIIVYNCHLKSPGVSEDDVPKKGRETAPDSAVERGRWRLEALSRAHAAAAVQRQFEACQLFHAAMADLAEDPSRPVAILGDLNDDPSSPALRALTPMAAFERDGGAFSGDEEGASSAKKASALEMFRIVDAFRLAPRSLERDQRPATHRSGARGDAIDFVLVSSALQPERDGSIASSVAYKVHDRHFRGGDPAQSSDHAGVSARFALK